MGYHKLGMQAIGIVYLSKHDGAERERDFKKIKIKRACYVHSHLYEHVHPECLCICN
jgi:hypothetical protein